MDLNDAFYFVQVVEKKGFTAAARALGIPKSRVSRRVKALEDALGARLIQRSSRQMVVTDVGQEYYRLARDAVSHLEAAEAAVRRKTNAIEGVVRLSCSVGMAQFALHQVLPAFLEEHPKVNVIQHASNQMVDVLQDGIDVAIRGHLDSLPDSSLIQVRLAQVEWHLFCAPAFLAASEGLDDPEALSGQACLALGQSAAPHEWVLENAEGRRAHVSCAVRLASDDMTTLKEAAMRGLGLVALPSYVCTPEVASGALVRVLPKWTAGRPQISLILPSRRGVLPAVEACVAHLRDSLPAVLSAVPPAVARTR